MELRVVGVAYLQAWGGVATNFREIYIFYDRRSLYLKKKKVRQRISDPTINYGDGDHTKDGDAQ